MPTTPPPEFRVMPPFRCCARTGNSERPFCAELAFWRRPLENSVLEQVFCGLHRQAGDEPIAGGLLVRRVKLTLDVELHGLGYTTAEAHTEALARLEGAVQSIAGLINLHGVGSQVGRFTVPAGPERRRLK